MSGTNGENNVTNKHGNLRHYAPWLLVIGVLAVAVASNLASQAHNMAQSGRPIALFIPVVDEISSALAWLVVLPVIVAAFRLTVPPKLPVLAIVSIHLLLFPIVSLTHYTLTRALRQAFFVVRGDDISVYISWSGYMGDLYADVLTYLLAGIIYFGCERLLASREPRNDASEDDSGPRVIEVRDGSKITYLPAEELLWAEAAGNYVELHASGGRTLLMRATLTRLAEELEGAGFLRVHRSRLVNAACVSEFKKMSTGDAALILTDGAKVVVSRRYRPAVAKALAARLA